MKREFEKREFVKRGFIRRLVGICCVAGLLVNLFPVNAFAMKYISKSLIPLYSTVDCSNMFGNVKDMKFKSSNPDVVRVVNQQIIALSEGTATVTGIVGKEKRMCKVEVKNFDGYFSPRSVSVSLFPGETFELMKEKEVKKLSFSSRDTSVAKVDKKGKITATAPGTTFVDISGNHVQSICAVTVIDRANETEIMSFSPDKNTKYYENWKFKNKSKYILAIHPKTYLPNQFEARLDKMIALIEKTMELEMHPKNPSVVNRANKPVIWVGGTRDTYSQNDGIIGIHSADMDLWNESALLVGRYVANCILYRNSTHCGEILGSYYGSSVAYDALENSELISAEYRIDKDSFVSWDKDWESVTAKDIEDSLTMPNTQSYLEFAFPQYLYRTYGAKTINKFIKKVNAANKKIGVTHASGRGISEKKALQICKSVTSPSVIEDFLLYMKEHTVYVMDECSYPYAVKEHKVLRVRPEGFGYAEYYRFGAANYEGSVIYDFTDAMRYFTVNCGQKVTGIYGVGFITGAENMTLKIYDKDDNLLDTMTGRSRLEVWQDGAVKVEVSADTGENQFVVYYRISNLNKYATQVQE